MSEQNKLKNLHKYETAKYSKKQYGSENQLLKKSRKGSKKQHINPVVYLRQFSNDLYHVETLNKKGAIHRSSIRKICRSTNFYTLKNNENPFQIEQKYSNFENIVYAKVLDIVKKDNIPYNVVFDRMKVFHEDLKKNLISVVIAQLFRGKFVRHVASEMADLELKALANEIQQLDILSCKEENEKAAVINDITSIWRMIIRDKIVESLAESTDEGFRSLIKDNLINRICVIILNETNSEFVATENPIVIYDWRTKKQGLVNCPLISPSSLLLMPLNPNVVVGFIDPIWFSRECMDRVLLFVNKKDNIVKIINKLSLFQSDKIVIARRRTELEELSAWL